MARGRVRKVRRRRSVTVANGRPAGDSGLSSLDRILPVRLFPLQDSSLDHLPEVVFAANDRPVVLALKEASMSYSVRSCSHVSRCSSLLLLCALAFVQPGASQEKTTVANPWHPARNMKNAHWAYAAAKLNDGRVLVAPDDSSFGELYDPSTGTWSLTGSMNVGHGFAASGTSLLDGRYLYNDGGDGTQAEVYDPVTNTWSLTGKMQLARGWGASWLRCRPEKRFSREAGTSAFSPRKRPSCTIPQPVSGQSQHP